MTPSPRSPRTSWATPTPTRRSSKHRATPFRRTVPTSPTRISSSPAGSSRSRDSGAGRAAEAEARSGPTSPRDDSSRRTPPLPPAPEVADPAPEQADPESAEDEAAPSWLLPGLAGAGALLAGSLWLVLRQHRRTQLRYRRPGRIIAPPPEELLAVEKSVQVTGSRHRPPDRGARCGAPGPRSCTAPGLRPTLAEPDRADARGAG